MKRPAHKLLFDKFHRQRPLAWAQLSHQKIRLGVAMGGIAFANVLIFMQLGFRTVFTAGAAVLPRSLAGDLFLINPSAQFIGSNGFARIRLYQAAAIKGVENSSPLYIRNGTWAYSKQYTNFSTRVFAFNPKQTVFNIPEINQNAAKLNLPNSVLFDRFAQPSFGPIAQQVAKSFSNTELSHRIQQISRPLLSQGRQNGQPLTSSWMFWQVPKGEVRALLNNRRISVVGLFSLGNSFFLGQGNVVLSEANYADIFGDSSLNQVSLGVLKLQKGANPEAVKAGIKANVPGVEVLTHKELIAKELQFQESNPAGTIFTFGAIMGFAIGVVIVYQVLYADVSDHLAEYATLKAMGYSDTVLLGVLFQESSLLAVLGFIPGLFISCGMYRLLASMTRLELAMSPNIAIAVFILTVVMCIASAAIASNKLRSADPADVF